MLVQFNIMATEKNSTMNPDLEAAPPAPSGHEKHERSVTAKDEAIAMVGEQGHIVDPAVVARAVRKIDWFLIPAMIFGCKNRPSTSPTHTNPHPTNLPPQTASSTTTKPSSARPCSSA
jgi:hypothetical protein